MSKLYSFWEDKSMDQHGKLLFYQPSTVSPDLLRRGLEIAALYRPRVVIITNPTVNNEKTAEYLSQIAELIVFTTKRRWHWPWQTISFKSIPERNLAIALTVDGALLLKQNKALQRLLERYGVPYAKVRSV